MTTDATATTDEHDPLRAVLPGTPPYEPAGASSANGPACCDACARSPRQRAAHARLAEQPAGTCGRALSTGQPCPEHARPADTTREDIRDAITFNDDTASPALATVRDLILTLPGSTPASALASARVVLAAHARELVVAANGARVAHDAELRERGDRSRVAYCGGMRHIARDLTRYADDLDAAAVDGEPT